SEALVALGVAHGRVTERDAQHRAQVPYKPLRFRSALAVLVRREPAHVAVAAGGEPRFVVVAGGERIERRHAHGVAAQLESARLHARGRAPGGTWSRGVVRQPSPSPGGCGGLGFAPGFARFFVESGGAPSVSAGAGAGLIRGGSWTGGGLAGGRCGAGPPPVCCGCAATNSRRAAVHAPRERSLSAGSVRLGAGPVSAGLRVGTGTSTRPSRSASRSWSAFAWPSTSFRSGPVL